MIKVLYLAKCAKIEEKIILQNLNWDFIYFIW